MVEQEVVIDYATKEDLDELFQLAERFWYESNFDGKTTLQPDRWKQTLINHIDNPATAAITAWVNGKIVGYVLIYYQTDYTVEPIGELYQFYVSPEFRGTPIARALVEQADLQFKRWGCARAYCEASPGMSFRDHLGMFANLWGKFGFEKIGVTLMKEF